MHQSAKKLTLEQKELLNKNILINPIHKNFQDQNQTQYVIINGMHTLKAQYSLEVPQTSCFISQNTKTLIFEMEESGPAEVAFKSFNSSEILENITFLVSSNQRYICKKIKTRNIREILSLEENWYNNGEMFELYYKQKSNTYKLSLIAKTKNNNGGFLTQKTTIKFQKQIYQQFDLIQVDDDEENYDLSNTAKVSQAKNTSFLAEMKKKIGGQDQNLELIEKMFFNVRSLLSVELINRLGVKHIKGFLLYGPPGTGKTALARQMADLSQFPVSVINGPQIMDKYVGESEKRIRQIFDKARRDQQENGPNSRVHVVIIDEIDAICKKRGTNSTNVYDSIVNQFLTCIDGVQQLNNILIIAMTNRKDLIDEAILRPGRIQIHLEIFLPSEQGRFDILNIHTKKLRSLHVIDSSVDLEKIAKLTQNYTGAEIQALVRKAFAYALSEWKVNGFLEHQLGKKHYVEQKNFDQALKNIIPQFGADTALMERKTPTNMISMTNLFPSLTKQVDWILDKINASAEGKYTILLSGGKGVGKTTFGCWMANRIAFEFTKFINIDKMIGLSEQGKLMKISDVLFDSLRCKNSCIIFDEIVDLIEYVPLDRHYSRAILQRFVEILKSSSEKGKKTVIIVTESRKELLRQLGLYNTFSFKLQIPMFGSEQISLMLKERGYNEKETEKVISKFKDLTVAEVCDIIESTKDKKESLQDYCEVLKMKRVNQNQGSGQKMDEE